MDKLSFTGKITSIQPRIRLMRSFDEVSHSYLGYAIKIEGEIDQPIQNEGQYNSKKPLSPSVSAKQLMLSFNSR